MLGLFLILCLLSIPAYADDTASTVGTVSVNVVDTTAVPDCSATVTENCIETVTVPECPAGQCNLDCICSQ